MTTFMTYKEECEALRQRVQELEERRCEICGYAEHHREHTGCLRAQLAAEQLNNKLLREALQAYIDEHEECQDADDWMAMMCSMEAHHAADEALSQPSDTSALDSFVAEKVKEIIESHAPDWRNVTNAQHVEMRQKFFDQIATLTRQRDLAVEAITRAIDMVGHPDNITYLQQTLDAIKESERK